VLAARHKQHVQHMVWIPAGTYELRWCSGVEIHGVLKSNVWVFCFHAHRHHLKRSGFHWPHLPLSWSHLIVLRLRWVVQMPGWWDEEASSMHCSTKVWIISRLVYLRRPNYESPTCQSIFRDECKDETWWT
jgi:hypothetical protein